VTASLLETIFYPLTPLHDGAVIIQRDRVVAAGGVCYVAPPKLRDAPPAAQLLGAATTATVGELFLDLNLGLSKWSDLQQRSITQLFQARRRHPALCAGGDRVLLPTSDDSRFYAFLRARQGEGMRMLVVLNFQPDAHTITVDLHGHAVATLVDVWSGESRSGGDSFVVTLPGYGYSIYAVR
jgi:hypothetical protein